MIVTAAVVRLTWSLAASLPKVTSPSDVKVRPSRLVTALISVVAVSPAAMVTSPRNVIAPAASAEVIPLAVASVRSNSVAPVLLIVIAAPVPSPIAVTEPTAPWKSVAPTTFSARS